ncbi:MAG: SMP-30/gluconolactonase/LRE family protein [Rhodospirillales bacterium]
MTPLSLPVDCIVDAKAVVAETPVWDTRENALWWVSIFEPSLNRYDPSTAKNLAYKMPAPIGSFALRERGGALVALKTGLHFFDPASGKLDFAVNPDPVPDHRLNEGKCDRSGNAFWVGSMKDPIEPFRGDSAFFRFSRDRKLERKIEGVITANATAFSPDNRTLYQGDSHPSVRSVFAWDHDPWDGAISNRRLFLDTHGQDGRVDGCCVDAEGCYWAASIDSGTFKRFTPKGKLDMIVKVPVLWPTMPAFGGKDLDTFYFTSLSRQDGRKSPSGLDGGVFAMRVPGVTGLPETRFKG